MSRKNERSSAAIFGLLDAIKSEGLKPIEEAIHNEQGDPNSIDTHILKSFNKNEYRILELDTKKIISWSMANRLDQFISEESCQDLIASIKSVGQQIPALVRFNPENSIYELICGARRLFVCKYLSIKIRVAVVELSDKEALLAMDAENRPRKDISPYERALDYKNWIDKGIYRNQTEIYNAIGMKKSLFTQVFALSNLDRKIVNAFGHPSNLTIKWGYQLSRLCKNEYNMNKILEKATYILNNNISMSPNQIYKELIQSIDKPLVNQTLINFRNSKGNINLHYNSKNKTIKVLMNKNDESEQILHKLVKILDLTEVVKV